MTKMDINLKKSHLISSLVRGL